MRSRHPTAAYWCFLLSTIFDGSLAFPGFSPMQKRLVVESKRRISRVYQSASIPVVENDVDMSIPSSLNINNNNIVGKSNGSINKQILKKARKNMKKRKRGVVGKIDILVNKQSNKESKQNMTFQEECENVDRVKKMIAVDEKREKLKEILQREPHQYELALALYGSDVSNMKENEVKRRLQNINRLQEVLAQGQESQSKLVSSHIGLVISIAKKYQDQGILQLADLVQEGNLGLIEAIRRFDATKGFRFGTYARWWVRHYIGRSITDNSRVIRLPAHVHTMLRKTEKKRKEFSELNGREPTTPELAHELNIPVEKLQLYTKSSNRVLSLETPLNAKPDGQDQRVLMDTIQSDSPTPEDHIEYALLRKDIFAVIDGLNEKQREVLVLRFGLDDQISRTIDEVASIMKISRERVRTMESKALNRLRHPLRNYKLKDHVGCTNQPENQISEFEEFFGDYSYLNESNSNLDSWMR